MKGIKKIIGWSIKYLSVFLFILFLNTVLQWFFSYLPLFVQYAFGALGYGSKDVALPNFLINWYESENDVLRIIIMVSVSMIVLQAVRSIMRFLCNYYQGALAQYIGYDMRVKV
ncbi:MAG: hypothetical protein IJY14_01985 [Acholeplasmatales bacterium]|nr:hypothetical protein [Acholeplasmatales bacterium]